MAVHPAWVAILGTLGRSLELGRCEFQDSCHDWLLPTEVATFCLALGLSGDWLGVGRCEHPNGWSQGLCAVVES